jgi:hypothetical protein
VAGAVSEQRLRWRPAQILLGLLILQDFKRKSAPAFLPSWLAP